MRIPTAWSADTPAEAPETGRTPSSQDPARMWGSGWLRYFFPAFWMIYIAQACTGVAKYSSGAAEVIGYVIVAAFVVTYLAALPMAWTRRPSTFWTLFALATALTAAECFFARQEALVFCVYLGVLTVSAKSRLSLPIVVVLAAVSAFLPPAVPSWNRPIGWSAATAVLLVAFAMFGFFKIIHANVALSAARSEVARLAAENERSRIARDLHDLLGHSLTTITVKAGLARRLSERGDADRARIEIAEVETLARRTLDDVRAAVSAHHEVTLAGELATATEVLRAAGIIAELPGSVAEVDPELSELFGWLVREGITNVVRHARAEHVRITLGRRSLEILDDGATGTAGPGDLLVDGRGGNGLRGLQHRVEAAGGTLSAVSTRLGFRLRAEVPAGARAVAPQSVDA